MLHCLPQCPTVRRQIREEVRKAGLTDEFIRKLIDSQPVDIEEEFESPRTYRKVKPDPRKPIPKVPLSTRKKRVASKDLKYDDEYKETQRKDYPDKIVQDSIRITDYKEIIEEDDEQPVATLKQETVYYAEEKEIAHVAPLVRQVSPRVIKISQIPQESEIESSIEDQKIIAYKNGKIDDIPSIYSRTETESSIEVQQQIDYEKEKANGQLLKVDAIIYSRAEEIPTTSKIVEDKKSIQTKDDSSNSYYKYTPEEEKKKRKIQSRDDSPDSYSKYTPEEERKKRKIQSRDDSPDSYYKYTPEEEKKKRSIQSRDDSPDSYYKYTPEEVPSDWPHDGCDQNCPAKILKERAEKLLEERQKYMKDRYLRTGLRYFEDVCTCSLGCMVHNLKKDRFVRSILTSAILFAFGIKLCSELYGWYLPNRI